MAFQYLILVTLKKKKQNLPFPSFLPPLPPSFALETNVHCYYGLRLWHFYDPEGHSNVNEDRNLWLAGY